MRGAGDEAVLVELVEAVADGLGLLAGQRRRGRSARAGRGRRGRAARGSRSRRRTGAGACRSAAAGARVRVISLMRSMNASSRRLAGAGSCRLVGVGVGERAADDAADGALRPGSGVGDRVRCRVDRAARGARGLAVGCASGALGVARRGASGPVAAVSAGAGRVGGRGAAALRARPSACGGGVARRSVGASRSSVEAIVSGYGPTVACRRSRWMRAQASEIVVGKGKVWPMKLAAREPPAIQDARQ